MGELNCSAGPWFPGRLTKDADQALATVPSGKRPHVLPRAMSRSAGNWIKSGGIPSRLAAHFVLQDQHCSPGAFWFELPDDFRAAQTGNSGLSQARAAHGDQRGGRAAYGLPRRPSSFWAADY